MTNRKWSSYGSDGEPADDVDDDVTEANVDNVIDVVTTNTTSSDDILTSASTSRMTADGCEDDDGAGALDLIRHVLLPPSRQCHSLHHSMSWKALDDGEENRVEELDSFIEPHSLTVDSH